MRPTLPPGAHTFFSNLESIRIHPRGQVAPRMFFELAHVLRRGGGHVIFVSARHDFSADRQHTFGTAFGPLGAATSRISENFGFRSQIALVAAPNRFRNRPGCQFRLGTRIGRFPKLPHNQHPCRQRLFTICIRFYTSPGAERLDFGGISAEGGQIYLEIS